MISVIISTYNDASSIRNTIAYVYANATFKRLLKEVIVVDGGSTDATVREAERTGATVIISPKKGRAAQMNHGAFQASGEILYFLQARSTPPANFLSEIVKAASKGFASGTFALRFDQKHWMLNLLSWIASKDSQVWLSDQSLFVTRSLFTKAGGFREDHAVMINQELILRIQRYTGFMLMKDPVLASSRKYLRHGIFKTGLAQAFAYLLYKRGFPQHSITWLYRKVLYWKLGPAPPVLSVADGATEGLQVSVEKPAFSGG